MVCIIAVAQVPNVLVVCMNVHTYKQNIHTNTHVYVHINIFLRMNVL